MAEYVFWTGDEKGVTLAIEEFLQEGLVSHILLLLIIDVLKYGLEQCIQKWMSRRPKVAHL